MFTCILIGREYFKSSSIYNALASSAFILLCYNPYYLWDVGFQLSYLAVAGIIWLQKPIYHLWEAPNILLDKIWNMGAVTIAAQVAAFPVCLYYFHQFPNLFLLTNLVAVPLSTLILFGEIFLICISWFEAGALYAGNLISFLIHVMNEIIIMLNQVPFSLLENIYINSAATLLLYGIVIFLCSWLLYRRKEFMMLSLICTVAFLANWSYHKWMTLQQKKIIVYNIPRTQAIDLLSKGSYSFIGDTSAEKPDVIDLHLKPARILYQVDDRMEMPVQNSHNTKFISFSATRIAIIDKKILFEPLAEKLAVDLLIISKNAEVKIKDIIQALHPGLVIFDSSNSLWKIARWKQECSALLLPFHSIPEQGAFVSDIK
jgi:competence protein ComEC